MPDLVAAVAEANRRRLLQLLAHGEQTVTELASNFTTSRSAISQHLGVLAQAGLVVSRREGRFQYYRLNPGGMAALRAELDAFWTHELDRLAKDAFDHLTDGQGGPLCRSRSRSSYRSAPMRPSR